MYPVCRIVPRSSRLSLHLRLRRCVPSRYLSTARQGGSAETDPRLGKSIHDDYARIRDHYETPKLPIVLAHGLLGFAELHLAPGRWLPPVHYWRGIAEALRANGVHVITTTVPPSGSLEKRAEKLAHGIADAAGGREVNIIAHSMGGLDARYMISHLRPTNVKVRSLVTVASPHHGSSFADFLFEEIGHERLPDLYKFLGSLGVETGAFEQLTSHYMINNFNPRTPDDPDVSYFSYGAMMDRPPLLSPFRQSHGVISRVEGPNDGLVSVASAQWGSYKGTLVNVSHLDLINWTNRWRWMLRSLIGIKPGFNAIAFYLGIADMLAKEGC
ncbi:Alpha/Beta hydrolase protein [Xylaria bambusicola]|uniref:Alpha/Beta hydrolase protein n=1 Tax=Xylaria bambusicola TaxID=326684 RepID=UPI0020075FBF|nr:Alpha/Beta hydrolase protein [Xylaria bambusicola]KAI0528184.1 Alpha/Beta hydrolase protein [Xylaria bambusicola]